MAALTGTQKSTVFPRQCLISMETDKKNHMSKMEVILQFFRVDFLVERGRCYE